MSATPMELLDRAEKENEIALFLIDSALRQLAEQLSDETGCIGGIKKSRIFAMTAEAYRRRAKLLDGPTMDDHRTILHFERQHLIEARRSENLEDIEDAQRRVSFHQAAYEKLLLQSNSSAMDIERSDEQQKTSIAFAKTITLKITILTHINQVNLLAVEGDTTIRTLRSALIKKRYLPATGTTVICCPKRGELSDELQMDDLEAPNGSIIILHIFNFNTPALASTQSSAFWPYIKMLHSKTDISVFDVYGCDLNRADSVGVFHVNHNDKFYISIALSFHSTNRTRFFEIYPVITESKHLGKCDVTTLSIIDMFNGYLQITPTAVMWWTWLKNETKSVRYSFARPICAAGPLETAPLSITAIVQPANSSWDLAECSRRFFTMTSINTIDIYTVTSFEVSVIFRKFRTYHVDGLQPIGIVSPMATQLLMGSVFITTLQVDDKPCYLIAGISHLAFIDDVPKWCVVINTDNKDQNRLIVYAFPPNSKSSRLPFLNWQEDEHVKTRLKFITRKMDHVLSRSEDYSSL
jgi:hypothetical protein